MKRVRNIANLILLTAMLLLAGNRYAFAQENTSTAPYLNSTQLYQVPMANSAANQVEWEITDGSSTRDLGNIVWADTSRSAGNHNVEITFVDSLFTNGSSWTISFYEYDAAGGGCIAVRTLSVSPVSNSFYLTMPNDAGECNELSETIIPNALVLTDDYDLTFPFDVHINKAADFRVTEWSFTGTLTITGTDYSFDSPLIALGNQSGNTNKGYGWNISNLTANSFKLTVTLTPAQIAAQVASPYTSDTLTFYAEMLGPPIYDLEVTLDLSNGEAKSGSSFTKTTLDNTSLGTDREFIGTFYGIPNTSVINISQ